MTFLRRFLDLFHGDEVIAECPDCHSRHLYRLASECESRYDGWRERSVQTGSRYSCGECSRVFVVRRDGPHAVKRAEAPAAVAPDAPKAGPSVPKRDAPTPRIRLPRSM